jgi:arylsulfatase A-like enzyme
MTASISRRDFLKLVALAPAGLSVPSLWRAPAARGQQAGDRQNVLVVVFDAWSAYNMSLYGYPRETMPNLAALSKRAIVYHNHVAGGTFTTPGTASLLTGTLPWTNRAMPHGAGVAESFLARNLFTAMPDYHGIAYAHTAWAYTILRQFRRHIEDLIPRETLLLTSYGALVQAAFANDQDVAAVAWERALRSDKYGFAYSLLMARLREVLRMDEAPAALLQAYPRGVPSAGGDLFLLEHAIDWINERLVAIPRPFVGYLHFFPPHQPYNTSAEFYNQFSSDSYKAIRKPEDAFSDPEALDPVRQRREYDEYLLYADRQFRRFYDALGRAGLLENTWLVVTADHGEMFERGTVGHSTDALYHPLLHIPLIVFEPGRETGMDVFTRTSAVDVLPTLAQVTGHAVPEWSEGVILPPYGADEPDADRGIYAVQSTQTGARSPLRQASTTLLKGQYKLHHYTGYKDKGIDELVLLFDIQADPEEMQDLSATHKGIADEMLHELKAKLAEVNRPYV